MLKGTTASHGIGVTKVNFVGVYHLLHRGYVVLILLLLSVFLCGCSEGIAVTSSEELVEFNNAGPLKPEMDIDRLFGSRGSFTTYRLVADDLLELQIPEVLQGVEPFVDSEIPRSYLCRVRFDGSITIPVIGAVDAKGSTIPELEARIIESYYPRYTQTPPSVVAKVVEYSTIKVSITGAVENPGIYELRNDQRSLVSLVMAAGGIVDDGAAVISVIQPEDKIPSGNNSKIRISYRSDFRGTVGTVVVRGDYEIIHSENIDVVDYFARLGFANKVNSIDSSISKAYVLSYLSDLSEKLSPGSGDSNQLLASHRQKDELSSLLSSRDKPRQNTSSRKAPIVLPVKGLNIPFSDVEIFSGSRVEVERLDPAVFTVVGLVNKPGAFPYHANTQYNLMQAIAFAGGVDAIADPRYVRVYREGQNGEMVDATFELNGVSPVGAPNIKIKPGDIVSVEQTARTKRNLLIAEVLRLNVGVSYNVFDGQDFRRKD